MTELFSLSDTAEHIRQADDDRATREQRELKGRLGNGRLADSTSILVKFHSGELNGAYAAGQFQAENYLRFFPAILDGLSECSAVNSH